jgi:TP901 family phage tail tape measure protein
MALAETAELAVRISLKDNVSAGVRGLQKNLGGLNRSLAQTGRGFGQIGAGVARAGLVVGGAAIAGITAAAKAAIDFEDAFAGVRKTVDEAELKAAGLSFEALARQFRDMATEIPVAATELAAIGETAGALGIKAQDIDDFTRTVALLGVTTDLTSDAAAEALGKVGTILNLTGQDFEHFADVLVNLGNQGASTESEIIEVTKRFAAIGRQAGLTTEDILALSSAVVSLGAEPEAGGSALSRIFANMATEIADSTKKGKTFAKVTGQSLDQLADRINKGDALGILRDTLEGLVPLSRTGRASVLKALGISNVRDRNAIVNMVNNLGFVDDQLQISKDSVGALGIEAQKRFDTVASKIKLLKNNLTEAAITLGEGFAPAIGRAAEKLSAFLQIDANRGRLKELGEDIGEAIDNIDWAAVLRGAEQFVGLLKGALTFAKLLFDAFMALPGPIKEATAGFLVLNKLSGGLVGAGVGNVVGGLAGAATQGLASRAPGVGRLFAQPVFVTNFPIGFGGGGGPVPVPGGGNWISKLGSALFKVTLISAAVGVFSELTTILNAQTAENKEHEASLNRQLQDFIKLGNRGALEQSLQDLIAIDKDMNNGLTPEKIAYQLDIDGVRTTIENQIATLREAIADLKTSPPPPKAEPLGPPRPGPVPGAHPFIFPEPPGTIEAAMERGRKAGFFPTREAGIATYERNMLRAAENQRIATQEAKAEAARTTLAVNAGTLALQGISTRIATQKPPIVTVNVGLSPTQLVTKEIYYNRAGPTGSSREQSSRGGPWGGSGR